MNEAKSAFSQSSHRRGAPHHHFCLNTETFTAPNPPLRGGGAPKPLCTPEHPHTHPKTKQQADPPQRKRRLWRQNRWRKTGFVVVFCFFFLEAESVTEGEPRSCRLCEGGTALRRFRGGRREGGALTAGPGTAPAASCCRHGTDGNGRPRPGRAAQAPSAGREGGGASAPVLQPRLSCRMIPLPPMSPQAPRPIFP